MRRSLWWYTRHNRLGLGAGNGRVIIDSCESGSLQSVLSGPGRIILTSTSPGEKAYFVNQGAVSYSSFFWTGVFNGLTLKASHDSAGDALKDTLSQTITLQTPLLDDDNGGTLATTLYIGNGTDFQSTAPQIGSVTAEHTISGTTSTTLTAWDVTDIDAIGNPDLISRVWAVIMPPGFTLGASDNAVRELPYIDLLPVGGNQYEATYDGFNLEGTYQIAIYARDRIGDVSIPHLTTVSVETPLRRKAIIVVGGDMTDPNWAAYENAALKAYNALSFQGYSDGIDHAGDDIKLLSNVTFTAARDDAASLSALSDAINIWAAGSTYDLVLYMIGDGSGDEFYLNGTDTLDAATLKGWLNNLQNDIDGIPGIITVINDSVRSGSYISGLTPLSGKKRILIASTEGEVYYPAEGDISFSYYFWSSVLNGWNVRDAFFNARSSMEFSTAGDQTGQINDNGNEVSNESGDGALAADYTIGMGIKLAGKDPLIGSVSIIPDPELHGELSATIRADNVTTTGTLAAVNPVWAVVTHPKGPDDATADQTIVLMNNVSGKR
jgi:hypothetical protein